MQFRLLIAAAVSILLLSHSNLLAQTVKKGGSKKSKTGKLRSGPPSGGFGGDPFGDPFGSPFGSPFGGKNPAELAKKAQEKERARRMQEVDFLNSEVFAVFISNPAQANRLRQQCRKIVGTSDSQDSVNRGEGEIRVINNAAILLLNSRKGSLEVKELVSEGISESIREKQRLDGGRLKKALVIATENEKFAERVCSLVVKKIANDDSNPNFGSKFNSAVLMYDQGLMLFFLQKEDYKEAQGLTAALGFDKEIQIPQ